jgi:hypothetical protein
MCFESSLAHFAENDIQVFLSNQLALPPKNKAFVKVK